jgi:hypothetical protein
MIEDGTYDAFVVDAHALTDGPPEHHGLHLDLTILSGPHKGQVVSMRAIGEVRDETDVLGLPATLTVVAGEPSLMIDG